MEDKEALRRQIEALERLLAETQAEVMREREQRKFWENKASIFDRRLRILHQKGKAMAVMAAELAGYLEVDTNKI